MRASERSEPQGSVYHLGSVEQIPMGEGRMFQVGHLAITVFRLRGGGVVATQALCPHGRGALADGLIGDGKVVCPLHSYKFNLLTGQPVGNNCAALQTYPVRLDAQGGVLLTLSEQAFEQSYTIEGALNYEPSQRSACSPFGSAND